MPRRDVRIEPREYYHICSRGANRGRMLFEE